MTARKIDSKIHASTVPTRKKKKTRNTTREGIGVRVENKHDSLEQLQKYRFPSSASDGAVAFRRERTKIVFPKQSEKSSSGTKLAEKGYLKRESKGGW